MKRILITKPCGYGELKIVESPSLKIKKDDEVIVETKYFGVNYSECLIRMGIYKSAKDQSTYPITPGFEFSGIVKEKGKAVKNFKVGEKVFGVVKFNAYATEVKVPENQLFKLPKNLTLEESAGVPVNFLTAHYALINLGNLEKGKKILVHSAGGGVGSAILQLAKEKGAFVVGIVGNKKKIEVAKKFGANKVIDYSQENLWKKAEEFSPEGYDLILEPNGIKTIKESFNHLAPRGKLIVYGFQSMVHVKKNGKVGILNWLKVASKYLKTPKFSPLEMANDNKSVMGFNLSYLFDEKEILKNSVEEIIKLFEKNKILPPKVKVYSFKEVGKSHKALESKMTVGKLVIKI
ncbi:MAG: zinc-binding dehydrogenase [Nanoarchaeota archaeon]|nr:zinc-binding dehydrogenase [Nanoarchaeota archaeon]